MMGRLEAIFRGQAFSDRTVVSTSPPRCLRGAPKADRRTRKDVSPSDERTTASNARPYRVAACAGAGCQSINPSMRNCARGRTKPWHQHGTRRTAVRRSPAQARLRARLHVRSGVADQHPAVDLRCCRSSSAITRPASVQQRLAPRTAVSRLAHQRRESNHGQRQTGTERQAEALQESPMQRSGSASRALNFGAGPLDRQR